MKAHAMRRSIWFLNVALIAALAGIGAWWFLDVREAVASAPAPVGPKKRAPQPYLGMVRAFNKDLENARTDVLSAPVKEKALHEVILRKDYEKTEPTHFIFTGRMPPTEIKSEGPAVSNKPAAPKGLAAIGEIDWLIYDAGEDGEPAADGTMIVFNFKSSQVGYFVIGEFVKESKDKPDRFKITGARAPEEGLYKVDYEIYDEGKDEPSGTGEIEWDNRKALPRKENSVIYVDPRSIATTDESGAGATIEGGPPPAEPVAVAPEVVRPETVTPAAELTREDLKPEIKQVNSRLVDIKFDDNTHRYFSRKGAKEMAESIKTQVAKDKLGNTIGLRLMDSGDAPADVLKIRRGDIIVSVDGKPVKERADIVRIAEGMREDTRRVTIVVDRNGRKITFHVDPRDPKTRRAAGAYADRELK